MQLWTMMCRAMQDRQVMLECSDKTGEGSGKRLLYYCLEKPMNNTKRQTDMTLKDELAMWIQFSSIQSLSRIQLFATPWTVARQASLSNIKHPGLTQTHVHQGGDTLSSHSPPTFKRSQHQGLFQWVSYSHQVGKVLEFQLQSQSFQWIFRTDFL